MFFAVSPEMTEMKTDSFKYFSVNFLTSGERVAEKKEFVFLLQFSE